MKNSLIFLISILFSGAIQAQTDSLLKTYKTAKTFKAKAEAANELIFAWRFDRRSEAIHLAKEILENPEIKKYPEIHARAFIRLGIVYDLMGKADSAVICNELALPIASKHKLGKQKSSALNNLGLIYWNYGQLDKATDYITRASSEFEKMKDTQNLANALNNLGLIMSELFLHRKAVQYHQQALQLFTAVKDDYGRGSAMHNIGFATDHKDTAFKYYYLAIDLQKNIGDDYGLAKTYNNIAIEYHFNKDSAQKYYQLAVEYHKKAENPYGQASTLGMLALYLNNEVNDQNKALVNALESERISLEHNYYKFLWKIEGILGDIYMDKGDFKNAAQHLKKAVSYKDSTVREEVFLASQKLELKYNVAKKEKLLAEQKTALAENQRVIAQRELEAQKAWIIIISVSAGGVVLVLMLLWYFNRRRLHSRNNYERSLAEERERSLQQVLTAQEEERKRIAKDLHDGIVQDLAVIKMNLDQLSSAVPETHKAKFETAKVSLEKTTKEVREISHQMMPSALRELGLIPALEDSLQKVLSLNNITYEFFHHGIEERFAEKIEISLYRITQELLNNVVKHSRASHVSLSLTLVNKVVTMHFEDNGKGFDVHIKKSGIGLTNLQSRVKIVNGEIRYETGEKSGTVAIVRVPV